MKTLFLVRHAKSSHGDLSLGDRERPLNDRGRHDASMMGKRLARHAIQPDRLVSSPALRALTTAQLFADALGHRREDIVVEDRLYASSADALLALVRALDATLDRVMLFGHNPEFSELARRLSGKAFDMPTCAVVQFSFDTLQWSDVGAIAPAKVVRHGP
jgi:phosphohistidine phosphatase